MRIISGTYKGRRLHPPNNLPLRPTTDFAKEALFDILNNLVKYESLRVLDLFAGTGSISYEFISRGCKSVTSLEKDPRCLSFIHHTGLELKMANLFPLKANAFTFFKNSHWIPGTWYLPIRPTTCLSCPTCRNLF